MNRIRIFLCGDVMTGRGIDQALPNPSEPTIHEPYVTNARDYLKLAERANGPLKLPLDFSYIWRDALPELEIMQPDFRIINLETSITTSNDYWPEKDIHYRMNPKNIGCITAAKVDCCPLANNHVLDWGYKGLIETLDTLRAENFEVCRGGQEPERSRGSGNTQEPCRRQATGLFLWLGDKRYR